MPYLHSLLSTQRFDRLAGAPTELRAAATSMQDSADYLRAKRADMEGLPIAAAEAEKDLRASASGLRSLANEMEAKYAR